MRTDGIFFSQSQQSGGQGIQPVTAVWENDGFSGGGVNWPVTAGTKVKLYPTGELYSAVISGDVSWNGFVFEDGSEVEFHLSGTPASAYLKESAEAAGTVFGASSQVFFYPEGQVMQGIPDNDIQAHSYTFMGGFFTVFYPSGAVQTGVLADSTELSGIVLDPMTTATLDEKGAVKSAFLNNGAEWHDLSIKPGTEITFFPDGRVESLVLDKNADYMGLPLAGDQIVLLYPSGSVRSFTPYTDIEINGIPAAMKGETVLHENGAVRSCVLSAPLVMPHFTFRMGTQAFFYQDGSPREGIPDSVFTIDGIQYAAGSGTLDLDPRFCILEPEKSLHLHENGKTAYATLDQDTEIGGIPFKALKPVSFYKSGKVRMGYLSRPLLKDTYSFEENVIVLDENGQIICGHLLDDASVTVNGIERELPYGSGLVFDQDGRVRAFSFKNGGSVEALGTVYDVPANQFVYIEENSPPAFGFWAASLGGLTFDNTGFVFVRLQKVNHGPITAVMKLEKDTMRAGGREAVLEPGNWFTGL